MYFEAAGNVDKAGDVYKEALSLEPANAMISKRLVGGGPLVVGRVSAGSLVVVGRVVSGGGGGGDW